MNGKEPVHEVGPGAGYDIDSDDYDTDEERENLSPDEYERFAEEAENGFTPEEVDVMIVQLKEMGLVNFLRAYLTSPPNAKQEEMGSLRKLLLGIGVVPPAHLRHPSTSDLDLLPFARMALSRILRRRRKLPQYNSLNDAVRLLKSAKNIIVLSGAGISTSCGIPDFRSSEGLYAQLQREGKYDLDDPQQMFDINHFKERPEVFYSFAKQIYSSDFTPSPCHRFIKLLEDKGVLLRNYTQNIDALESIAGVKRVLQCHGSFKTASCLRCKRRVPGKEIESYIMSQSVPYCQPCRQSRNLELEQIKAEKAARRKAKGKGRAKGWGSGSDAGSSDEEEGEWGKGEPGIMKPDITFFGQALSSEFDECLFRDREKVDLLIVIGTSLRVAPVSEVLAHIPHSIPQIYINMEEVNHVELDICLIGDADKTIGYLAKRMGLKIPPPPPKVVSFQSTMKGTSTTNTKEDTENVNDEEAIWLSGMGDMSHMHYLSSPENRARMSKEDTSSSTSLASSSLKSERTDDGEVNLGKERGEPKSILTAKVEQVTVMDPDEKATNGDRRPTKRSRVYIEEEV